MQQGILEGIQQAIEKGQQVGELQAQLKLARNRFANGFALEMIATCTGLSVSEVEQHLKSA